MNDVVSGSISAIVGALAAGVATWIVTTKGELRSRLKIQVAELQAEILHRALRIRTLEAETDRLRNFEYKYTSVKQALAESAVVREFKQPILLVGPRSVGKTSLLAHWHAPWDYSRLAATRTHLVSTVPVYDFRQDNREPHFADPDISTDVHVHLKLSVHDFPGELAEQEAVRRVAVDQSSKLRQETGKSLGIVLICLFDASEVSRGMTSTTREYYNGDLFRHLREMVTHSKIEIERVILVFNKYDLLQLSSKETSDDHQMKTCLKFFQETLDPLRGVCHPEKFCEVFTILNREEAISSNRGASVVLGEAARRFVYAMAGAAASQSAFPQPATTHSAQFFK